MTCLGTAMPVPPSHAREIPFLRCSLRSELMSDDLPTLGTPITMMLYSAFWKQGYTQAEAGYQPATPQQPHRSSPAFAGTSRRAAPSPQWEREVPAALIPWSPTCWCRTETAGPE